MFIKIHKMGERESKVRIRISFNADPDPAFYLSADPYPDPGSQTNEDPCRSGSWSEIKKLVYIQL